MQRQSIIILIEQNKEPIARGNFKKLCDEFNFPYHSLKMLKFPVAYKDAVIHKVEFKQQVTTQLVVLNIDIQLTMNY